MKQNIFASYNLKAELNTSAIGPRIKYVSFLIDLHSYYPRSEVRSPQTEEGIIGDFQTCVVQILYQDMNRENTLFWSFFCQISDSTTSYGYYSSAVPNEKKPWGKLAINTSKFIIESDVIISASLTVAYVLYMC